MKFDPKVADIILDGCKQYVDGAVVPIMKKMLSLDAQNEVLKAEIALLRARIADLEK